MEKRFATGGGMAKPAGSFPAEVILRDHKASMVGFVTSLPREAPPCPSPLCHPEGVAAGHAAEAAWVETWYRPNTRRMTLGEFLAEGEVGRTWRSAERFCIGLAAGESVVRIKRIA